VSSTHLDSPKLYGRYALLKQISDEEDRPVYLVSTSGSSNLRVLKSVPLEGTSPAGVQLVKTEIDVLARMHFGNLAHVLEAVEVEGGLAFVMEFVSGKPLDVICGRAEQLSLLLPSELGIVVAHDILAAATYFHGFEGAGRVHGNISHRTILVSETGEAKLAGFRPGAHERLPAAVQVAQDVRPLAAILFDLPFERFPQELAHFVPQLIDEKVSTDEAIAATGAFLISHRPTVRQRQALSAWLEKLFPGEASQAAAEHAQLMGVAAPLLTQASAQRRLQLVLPRVGDEVSQYLILRVLGEGGMGRVYEARDPGTSNLVALKVLHPKRWTDAIEERIRREAQSILHIVSDHVVRIDQFGPTSSSKYLWLAMERLRGKALDELLAEIAPLDLARALKIASQMCQALAAAHAAGVIHRDLKPRNVMLTQRQGEADFVKILDFSLARLDTGEAALLQAGEPAGVFRYVAPEQVEGNPATPKVDIYAVGEILYEMLTGKLPHGRGEDILALKVASDPTPITLYRGDLPEIVSRLVMKALARKPEERHASMKVLGQEIDQALAQLTARVPRLLGARNVAVGAAAVVLLGGAVLVLGTPARAPVSSLRGERHPVALVGAAVPSTPPEPVVPSAPPLPAALPALPVLTDPAAADLAPAEPSVPPPPQSPNRRRAKVEGRSPSSSQSSKPPSAEAMLRAAEANFESGNPVEAIHEGRMALKVGGGLRVHLALAKYYQSLRLYQEALEHYRAALAVEPGNGVAQTGIKVVERQLPR